MPEIIRDGLADYIERALAIAREALTAQGLPGHYGPFIREDMTGEWFPAPGNWRELGRDGLVRLAKARGPQSAELVSIVEIAPAGAARDAARVIEAAHYLRQALEDGDGRRIAEWGVKLAEAGVLLNGHIVGWREAAEIGARVRDGGRKGAHLAHGDRTELHERWRMMDRALLASGIASERGRALAIARECGGDHEIIRQFLRRRQKSSGIVLHDTARHAVDGLAVAAG